MLNSPGNHGHWMGLSVGATNLAGTRDSQTAVIRPAELWLRGQRLTGFVDRVGDPVPMVAPDGATYRSEELLADALGAMSHAVTEGTPISDAAVTVPAHWRPSVVDILRRSLRDKLPVVSDATAALAALRANPGLPTHGVIVLCDFGGSGTSITLANAARDFSPFGETVRFPEFSGDQIDQALLSHFITGLADVDPSGTAMVGSLVRLRDECRRAKERLSAETATAVIADLPGHRADIRITRTELEVLMQASLTDFLAALDETLERYGVPKASVAAVATIGGGARIPLVTQRLSEHLRAPVVTTPHPQLTAAVGAALIARRARAVDTATVRAAIVPVAAAAAGAVASTVALVANEQALAWSEDSEDDAAKEVLPYHEATDSRPEVVFRGEQWQDNDVPPRRGPLVLFGLSAVAATVAATVFGFSLLSDTTTTPVEAATTSTSTASPTPAAPATLPAPPAPQAPQVTTVVVQQPAPRYQAPRQAPVTHQPYVPPTTEVTTTSETPPTTDPTPPSTPPTPPPTSPPSSPKPPPIDPGPGNGGTGTGGTGTGTGGSGTGTGTGTSGTGTGTGTGTSGTGTGTGTGSSGTGPSQAGTGTGTGGTGSGTGGTGTGAGGTSMTPKV
ncbi:molecular chaperone [Mycobacterium sp. JS623]|uniref:Hsp70 family protein n=1 Tax=Mycobacterium sp. JS623 TaxID=212767 RepID=UPI0002A5A3FB|nr:Hsp70 family protein [Mycobacterium sp. JS623]AGB20808.1 molecular chaperone [Mycobacterium sp. JS623]